ncbi:MAG: FAD-binding oxidoreductase [Gammaproteobacteria bacterium]|nr:FAD-binding oxidoreductase [Gammaproteobacteria bacterium]MBI5616728.1 FAD-binding oxidoreductase [Gammaproteobacteria bacterium]
MSTDVSDWLAAELPGVTVLTTSVDLFPYERDASVVPRGIPEAAVQVRSPEEVAALLARANAHRTPVYVRGGGTMYAGGAVPRAGGLVIDVSTLDRLLEVDVARGVVVVEPGMKFGALLAALEPYGLTVGVVPVTAPAATVGGAASAHALGTGSPRNQSFADEVVGLEAVLADGRVIRTGTAAVAGAGWFQRYAMGPDLTGLFLGGDATLGVITKVALWLHPLPERRTTVCFGFPDAVRGAHFVLALQNAALTRHVWYGAGYEALTIRARLPAAGADALPRFCLGLDLGGEHALVDHDLEKLHTLARQHGGRDFPEFDAAYFRTLREQQSWWYSFAGYFARSRCALMMSSLPTDRLPALLATVDRQRGRWPHFTWGGAVVLCRRGLHGAVIAFYDEATQWEAVQPAVAACGRELVEIGCVPYKSGKLWAAEVERCGAYHGALRDLKARLDPQGILSPGNLGL